MTPDRNGICEKEIIQINKHIRLKSATRGPRCRDSLLWNDFAGTEMGIFTTIKLVSFLAPVLALPAAVTADTMA